MSRHERFCSVLPFFVLIALLGLTTNVIAQTVTLTTDHTPSATYGQTIVFTVEVAEGTGGGPSGNVTFADNGVTLPSGTVGLTTGGCPSATQHCSWATYSTSTLAVGTHPITATYATITSSTVSQIVVAANTTTTISGSASSTVLGQEVVFTATVDGGGGHPTGGVLFKEGSVLVATATLVAGAGTTSTATFRTSVLPIGLYSIDAYYLGDSNFGTSDTTIAGGGAGPVSHTVTKRTTLKPSMSALTPNPVGLGPGLTSTFTTTVTDDSSNGPAGSPGTFAVTTDAPTARSNHAAALLLDGKVLIAGGLSTAPAPLTSSQLYDVVTGLFNAGPTLAARAGATATLLQNGTVLLVGGTNGTTVLNTAEIYDPATGNITAVSPGQLGAARMNHTATLLADGTVLIVGGEDSGGALAANQVEIFTPGANPPTTGAFAPVTGDLLSVPRTGHTATLLTSGPNAGKVLIVGGEAGGSAQLYSVTGTTGTSSPAGTPIASRSFHSAVQLPNGLVLLAGGIDQSSSNVLSTTEFYDPATGLFADAGTVLPTLPPGTGTEGRQGHTATLLNNALVLIVGGSSTTLATGGAATAALYTPAFDPLGTVTTQSTGTDILADCTLAPTAIGVTSCQGSVQPGATGNDDISAAYQGDAVHDTANGTSDPSTLVVKNVQTTPVTVTGPTDVTYLAPGAATASGGDGTGEYTFSITADTTGCSLSGTNNATVTVTNASGVCKLTAIRLGDSTYIDSAPSAPFAVTLHRAAQTTAVTVTAPTDVTYLIPGSATASGGDGTGAYTFSTTGGSTGCSLSGLNNATVTVTDVSGVCKLTAIRLADNNYDDSAASAEFPVLLHKGEQAALTVNVPASGVYNQTYPLTTTGGSTAGAVTYDIGTSDACTLGGVLLDQLTITKGTLGTCAVTATMAGDTNYNPVSSAATPVTLAKAAQTTAVTVTAPTDVTYLTPETAVAGGGDGSGAYSFSTTADTTGCSLSGTNNETVTVTNASGVCKLTAIRLADGNFNASAASLPFTVTMHKIDQGALTANVPNPGTYGQTYTLTTSGGDGTGIVTYDVGVSDACTVAGNQLTVTKGSGGSCTVTATKAADGNYNAVSSAATPVTLAKANQPALTVNVPNPGTYNQTYTLTSSGGGGTGTVTYDIGASDACTLVADQLTITMGSGGTCTVTASKAGDANFNAASSSATPVTLGKANQAALTANVPALATFGQTYTLTSSGGSGTGAVSYSVGASDACTVSTDQLTITQGSGTCTVTATKAADANYSVASSAAAPVTLGKAAQAALTTNVPNPGTFGQTYTLTTSGGSGTGAVTYDIGASDACTLSGDQLTITKGSGGACTVTATKAADGDYTAISSPATPVTLAKAAQAALTANVPSPGTFNQTYTLATAGGSGTGVVTYDVGASDACTLSGDQLTITKGSGGACTVTATKATDADYTAISSVATSVTLAKAAQAALTANVPALGTFNQTYTLTSTGGSGTGPVTYDVGGSDACNLSADQLTITKGSGGSCTVTAIKATDPNYLQGSSAAAPVTLAKADQAALVINLPGAALFGQTYTLSTTGGSGGGAVSYDIGLSDACTLNVNQLTIINTIGTCTVTATKAADANYNLLASAAAVSIGKADTISVIGSEMRVANNAAGGTFKFTATVKSKTTGTPTGTVTFWDNGVSIGSAPLIAGVATLDPVTPIVLTPSTTPHAIKVTYSGDAGFNKDDIGVTYSIYVEPALPPITAGTTGSGASPTLTVTYNGGVTTSGKLSTADLHCSVLSAVLTVDPTVTRCTATLSTALDPGQSGTLTVAISTDKSTIASAPPVKPTGTPWAPLYASFSLTMPAIVFVGLAAPFGMRNKALRRKVLGWMGLVLVVGLLLASMGCGGGSFVNKSNLPAVATGSVNQTPAGSYTVVVTYTDKDNNPQVLASMGLTVI